MKKNNKPKLAPFAILLMIMLFLTGAAASCGGSGQESPGSVTDRELLGLQIFPSFDTKIPSVQQSWIRNQRMEVTWASLETQPGNFDFSLYDDTVNKILASGSESILLLLNGPIPVWEQDPQYGSMADRGLPLNLADWYRFCSEVARHYGSVVDYYEIWNEPGWDADSSIRYTGVYTLGGQVETDYLPLLQLANAAIKENDPSASVICGALMYNLIDDPNTGQQNYALLFDDENRPQQNISLSVDADKSILAERRVSLDLKGAWKGGQDEQGDTAPKTTWQFPEGRTRPGFETRLILRNPQAAEAAAGIDYVFPDGKKIHKDVRVGANAEQTVNVNDADLGVGQTGSDFFIRVTSDRAIVAACPITFDYSAQPDAGQAPAGHWRFDANPDASIAGYSVQDRLVLENPGGKKATATIDFTMPKGEQFARKVDIAASSSIDLEINRWIGFNGSCDMVGVHPYRSPKFWAGMYTNIVNTLKGIGTDKEVVVTEVGWPSHSDHPPDKPDPFSEQYQTDAIAQLGVGGLFDAGCKKIWVFRDFDEDPGGSWDGNYYGLWTCTGQPRPAWDSYVSWQRQLPTYPALPASLP
jgi:hypothetical protein